MGNTTGAGAERVSQFGEYRGYSEPVYDGYVRRSDYLTLADGAGLAYDVLLPTRKEVPAEEPLPVLFMHTTYLRAMKMVDKGKIIFEERDKHHHVFVSNKRDSIT